MFETYIIYFGVLIATMLLIKSYRISIMCGEITIHKSNYIDVFSVFVVSFPLVLLLSLRFNIGTDYSRYSLFFDQYIRYDWIHFELGYEFLMTLTDKLNYGFPFLIFLSTLCTIIPIIIFVLRSECEQKEFMILTAFCLFLGSWECIIRQVIAISFIALAFQNAEKKNKIRFAVWAILAFLFHYMSVVVVPLYFLTERRNNGNDIIVKDFANKIISRSLIIVVFGLIASFVYIYYGSIFGLAYSNYLTADRVGGQSAYFVLISGALLIPEFIYCSRVLNKYPRFEVYYYMVVLEFLLYGIGFFIPYGFRVAQYFTIGHVVLVPSVIGTQDKGKNKFVVSAYYVFLLVGQFVVLYLMWGYGGITPYTSILGQI